MTEAPPHNTCGDQGAEKISHEMRTPLVCLDEPRIKTFLGQLTKGNLLKILHAPRVKGYAMMAKLAALRYAHLADLLLSIKPSSYDIVLVAPGTGEKPRKRPAEGEPAPEIMVE